MSVLVIVFFLGLFVFCTFRVQHRNAVHSIVLGVACLLMRFCYLGSQKVRTICCNRNGTEIVHFGVTPLKEREAALCGGEGVLEERWPQRSFLLGKVVRACFSLCSDHGMCSPR